MHRIALLCGLSLGVLGLARQADAASATCEGPDGSCEVSNDKDVDSFGCECANGGGDGGAGGDAWAGLSEEELQEVCEQVLEDNCGDGPPPPKGVPCEDKTGSCVVDNNPDFVTCSCADEGGGDGGEGGNAWDDYDEDQLYEECLAQLENTCGPVEPTGGSMDSGGDSAGEDAGDAGDADGGGEDGADGGETGAGGTDGGGDAADGDGEDDGGEAGQEGGDEAGQGDEAGGDEAGDTGNDTDGSADGGAGDDEGGGSKGCSIGGGPTVGLLSLALLFGVRRRW